MIERADNLAYWGPAKQLVMGAMKAGVNLLDAKEFRFVSTAPATDRRRMWAALPDTKNS